MSHKPVSTKKFKKYLKSLGLEYKRTHGDHEIWDYPDASTLLRPVTFIGCEKEVPAFHIKKNLETLNIDHLEFDKMIQDI
jgi:predicted RNA binding protein YcfA (HicA-like mRNA interferase family)